MTAFSFWPFLPIANTGPDLRSARLRVGSGCRVPWSRKALLGLAAAYVASPIDLIPDFIPFTAASTT